MTTRLYYDDSRLTTFEARVLSCVPADGRYEVVLDCTAFYPTSGGQPFDTGTIDERPVVDVIDRDDAGIAHVVTGAVESGATVRGLVDLARRRDHMEQHTGQHVLSAALDRGCGAATVGFHMGEALSTIDLSREVTAAEVAAAEDAANQVIRDDRSVVARIVPAEDAARLRLRRESTRTGSLRIVEIEDVDVSACGGTHVVRTGEIGLVAVVATEKVRGGTRLSFLAGGRAVAAFRRYRDVAGDVGGRLGVAPLDIGPHVSRLVDRVRRADRTIRDLRDELAAFRAAEWCAQAETIGPHRVVLRDCGVDGAALKALAQAVVAHPGVVVVLGGAGEPTPIVVARSGNAGVDAGTVIKMVAAALGGRGGGRPELAQGAVPAAWSDIAAFVRRALGEEDQGG